MTDSLFISSIANEIAQKVAEILKPVFEAQKQPAEDTRQDIAKGYLSRKQVAEQLHISLFTLNQWQKTGKLPAHRIGRRVLYKASEIDKALTLIKTKKPAVKPV